MKIINYSAEPLGKLYSWLPRDLVAEKVIFFPDVNTGKAPLPTGTVVFTKQENWRKFALSDCGCGMLLAKSNIKKEEFKTKLWDKIYFDLKANKNKLGDLGSGNHFLDALESYESGDDYVYFLIHTGSRNESKSVEDLVDLAEEFDDTFGEVCQWAKNNRLAILDIVGKYFGAQEIILDRDHNNFELVSGGVIIRKGAVKVNPGELAVLPSNLDDDVVLVRATDKVADTYNSLNHGTGRTMSRSQAKEYAKNYDYQALRKSIYIPEMISDASIKTEAPFCYRNLDECLNLIDDLITVEKRFKPFAYIGQV